MQRVIDIALNEVGYLEKKSNAYLDNKIANAGSANYTKYGRDMHAVYPSVMDFPAAWCDAFVDWCFYKAYGLANAKSLLGGNFDDYTVASAQLYKNKNAWHSTPKVGDQIFFKNTKRICHTGLVYKVDSNYVYTVEGNTSGASGVIANGGGVCKKKYTIGYSKIAGYGRPNYSIVNKATLESAQQKLKEALKIVEGGNSTLKDAQDELKSALKITNSSTSKETNTTTNKSTTTTATSNTTSVKKVSDVKMPQIKKGSKGKAVKVWQAILGVSIDGDFGSITENATIAFQKKAFPNNNKEWDGIVGDKTWKAGLESV